MALKISRLISLEEGKENSFQLTFGQCSYLAGVTLEATLHSSISTSGKFSLDGLKLIDFQIDLPQEKAEIISFKLVKFR